ncbi:MAG: CBS domain-containing protein [Candidatus Desantisbacteria bacterium]
MEVKNIMTELSELKVIYPDTQIKEAVRIMLSANLTELPVIDRNGIFQGELSMRGIICDALPTYIVDGSLKNVNFSPGLFKFEDKLKDLMLTEVKIVMKQNIRTLTPSISTFGAVTLFSISGDETVYIVEKDGRLMGAVSISVIFKRLIE